MTENEIAASAAPKSHGGTLGVGGAPTHDDSSLKLGRASAAEPGLFLEGEQIGAARGVVVGIVAGIPTWIILFLLGRCALQVLG